MGVRLKHHAIALLGYILAFGAGIVYAAIDRTNGVNIEVSTLYELLGMLIGMYLSGIFIINRQSQELLSTSKKVIACYLFVSYSVFIAFTVVILYRMLTAT